MTPSLITESNTLCFSYTLESMPEILKPVSASTYFIFIFIDNVNVHYQFNIYRCMYVCMYVCIDFHGLSTHGVAITASDYRN